MLSPEDAGPAVVVAFRYWRNIWSKCFEGGGGSILGDAVFKAVTLFGG